MAKKNLNYPDKLRDELQLYANETFNGNLNLLINAMLEMAIAHFEPKIVRDFYYDQRKKEQL